MPDPSACRHPAFRLLAIETTCDETAAAVITGEGAVLSNVVASQEELHIRFGGVVPEVAARAHLERILPVLQTALEQAATALEQLDAIAVAYTPGLAGSLIVGLATAKTLAMALNKPLVAVNHLHAHVYAGQLISEKPIFPCVALIASGGHTALYDCQDPLQFRYLGGTTDDAAGEAFDKAAALLGLPYPGGPSLEKAAAHGNAGAYTLPRPLLQDESQLDFSFSGLKTALRYAICPRQDASWSSEGLTPPLVADLSAAFQAAVVDCLVGKARQALKRLGTRRLCLVGGVACNRALRSSMEQMCRQLECELIVPPKELCTDNAAMGAIALEQLQRGDLATLELEITPGLVRPGR